MKFAIKLEEADKGGYIKLKDIIQSSFKRNPAYSKVHAHIRKDEFKKDFIEISAELPDGSIPALNTYLDKVTSEYTKKWRNSQFSIENITNSSQTNLEPKTELSDICLALNIGSEKNNPAILRDRLSKTLGIKITADDTAVSIIQKLSTTVQDAYDMVAKSEMQESAHQTKIQSLEENLAKTQKQLYKQTPNKARKMRSDYIKLSTVQETLDRADKKYDESNAILGKYAKLQEEYSKLEGKLTDLKSKKDVYDTKTSSIRKEYNAKLAQIVKEQNATVSKITKEYNAVINILQQESKKYEEAISQTAKNYQEAQLHAINQIHGLAGKLKSDTKQTSEKKSDRVTMPQRVAEAVAHGYTNADQILTYLSSQHGIQMKKGTLSFNVHTALKKNLLERENRGVYKIGAAYAQN